MKSSFSIEIYLSIVHGTNHRQWIFPREIDNRSSLSSITSSGIIPSNWSEEISFLSNDISWFLDEWQQCLKPSTMQTQTNQTRTTVLRSGEYDQIIGRTVHQEHCSEHLFSSRIWFENWFERNVSVQRWTVLSSDVKNKYFHLNGIVEGVQMIR